MGWVPSVAVVGLIGRPTSFTGDALGTGTVITYANDVQDNLTAVAPLVTGISTTCYTYDNNSNQITKTDARGKTLTQAYDALNRVSGKTYNDSGATPAVTYTYAGASQTADFPAAVSSSASLYSYSNYDALGRAGAASQTTNGGTYTFTGIQWTPQGDMKSVTYPTGRTVVTSFDGAGRPAGLSGTLNSNVTAYTGTGGVQYAAQGSISQLNTGEGVNRAIGFNSRLQVSSLGVAAGGSSLLSLGYTYGVSASQNNGNVANEAISRPGFGAQSFGYDGVNRLTSASESGGWNQNYVFDALGNRAVTTNAYIPATSFTPQTSNSTVPFDGRNHWTGAGYDPAGNMTSLVSQILTYDAEGRLTSLNDGSTVNDTFTYDGDGRRATKTNIFSGAVTTYVYDPNGQLAMEVGGAAPAVTGTLYVTRDRLGSTRMVTAAGGSVVGCHDYLPFGEEIPGAVSGWGRSGVSCYTQYAQTPETDVKFTGQLFDAETGLAYFNARYLRASMGSFISADEPLNDQWGSDPQSWKLDSYARNNPLRFGDPSGMDCQDLTSSDPCFSATGIANEGYLGWEWFVQNFQYYLNTAATNVVQPIIQIAVPVAQYLSAPRNQGCMNAFTVGGSSLGFLAGGGVGTLGLAGGPAAAVTIPGGAAGGGALGGAAGGAIGMIACNGNSGASSGGGSTGGGSGKGGPASEKTAKDMARQIERDLGADARTEFHDLKEGGAGDRTLAELKADAKAIYQQKGRVPPKWMQ